MSKPRRVSMKLARSVFLLGFVGALMALAPTAFGATPVSLAPAWTPQEQAATPERDWINVGGNIQQQHYSKLAQITPSNAGSLKEAWHIHLDGSGTLAKYNNEATPLVYNGVMY